MLQRLELDRVVGRRLRRERRQRQDVVDVHDAGGHRHDEPSLRDRDSERLRGEAHNGVVRVLRVVDVQGSIPRGGDEDARLRVVDDAAGGLGVRGEDGLVRGGEVEAAHVVVEPDGVGGVGVGGVGPGAVEDGGAVGVGRGLRGVGGVVEVEVAVPGGDEEARGVAGVEAYGGDDVRGGWGDSAVDWLRWVLDGEA